MTDEPAHVGFVPVVNAIETAGVTIGLTVIVIPVDVAVAGIAQERSDVIIQLTTSLLASVVVVKTEEFVPTFVVPIFH